MQGIQMRSVLVAHERLNNAAEGKIGGSGQIRTADLTLIRGAL